MIKTSGYAALRPNGTLAPFEFTRREPKPNDVLIEIDYCGVCHSDIHQVKNEWGNAVYPMVPGHEIVGHIKKIGTSVSKFKVGDLAGVGCLIDSCRSCINCKDGYEQFCENGSVGTYNGIEKDGITRTFGGYSKIIVLHEDFALKIPKNLNLPTTAPLLCAGITTYSPLRHWGVGPGQKVGVVGLGRRTHAEDKHVFIDTGSLPQAIVASAAVPVLFSPVRIPTADNNPYMDGGVACRIGLQLWRQNRTEVGEEPNPAAVHLIGRSTPFSGNDSLENLGAKLIIICLRIRGSVYLFTYFSICVFLCRRTCISGV